MRSQSGFTLIELAIVLVVVGLLVAAIVVSGPAVIASAKGKETTQRISKLRTAIQAFREQRSLLPGDYPARTSDMAGLSATCAVGGANAGNGNGLISATEAACVGEHLFQAGLSPSSQLASDFGAIQVISRTEGDAAYNAANAVAPSATLPGAVRNIILLRNVPCNVAQSVDRVLDDDNLVGGAYVVSLSGVCSGTSKVWLAVAVQ